jgi:hypothetical protein
MIGVTVSVEEALPKDDFNLEYEHVLLYMYVLFVHASAPSL